MLSAQSGDSVACAERPVRTQRQVWPGDPVRGEFLARADGVARGLGPWFAGRGYADVTPGHFALTNLLLEHVTGRVVTMSSSGYRLGAIDFDDLQRQRRRYKRWRAYGQSKLANLLFTAELQRKLTAVASGIKATAAHPGYAATNLQFHWATA